jgi:hypothetical protein
VFFTQASTSAGVPGQLLTSMRISPDCMPSSIFFASRIGPGQETPRMSSVTLGLAPFSCRCRA